MRNFGLLGLLGLMACKDGAEATVEGTAMGITIGETPYVFVGGGFVVISTTDVDCMDLSFVRTSYQEGTSPTETDVKFLQVAFTAGDVTEGQKSVGLGASVTSTLVQVNNGTLTQDRATSGSFTVDTLEEEGPATGSFQDLAFADGSLSGTFVADWCINMKDR